MNAGTFPGRLGLQQRVVPSYRAPFFDALAEKCQGGLYIFAGKPLAQEGIESVDRLQAAQINWGKNRNFLDPSSSWYICWQAGVVQWLEDYQPDILIVEANPRYPVTPRAIQWMHRRKRKVIGWGLGAPAIRGIMASLRQRQRLSLLHSLDAIVAYSRRGAEQYLQMGFPAARMYVASNSVSPAPDQPPQPRSAQLNKQPVILFVGRLQTRKRVDLLLQACSSLAVTSLPRLTIVGDGPAYEELQQTASKLYPMAEFVGPKQGKELEQYFQQADLFVLPGTGGLAIQQAMAHGLPVIVAKGDGTQEDLVRAENGWLVQPDDRDALVSILQQALSDLARLRRMGEASYRIVANEINVDRMVEVFIRAVNEVHQLWGWRNKISN